MYRLLTICFFIIQCFHLPAQEKEGVDSVFLRIESNSTLDIKKTVFVDSLQMVAYLDSLRKADFANGFLLANMDTLFRKDSVFVSKYYQGPNFSFGTIRYDQSDAWLKDFIDYDLQKLEGKVLTPKAISKLSDQLITDLENRGYPFAEVRFANVDFEGDQLNAEMLVDRKKLIRFDTLTNIGLAKISKNYLRRYLEIRPGDVYDRRKVNALVPKLRELSFLSLKENPKISFVNEKAQVVLNLNKNKSSNFDFIIGLLQNNTPQGQRYTFVTDFSAEMRNQLSYGERIFIHFQRLRPENQSLALAFEYPFLLDTPFGISLGLNQFRNENKWIDRSIEVGGQYFLGGNDFLYLNWNNRTSRIIDVDSMNLVAAQSLPQNLDISYNGVSLGVYVENLDYRFNPKSGTELLLSGEAGLKDIKRNLTIESLSNEDVDFSALYDSLTLNTYQLTLKLEAARYQPVARNITIKTGIKSAYRFNEGALFENELFRIGGNKLLRGFDEQSVLSSFYGVFTAELRFILAQQNNNFTLSLPFVDYGWEYNPLRSGEAGEERWDNPVGVGVGLNFQTGAGIFSFATAAGRRRGNSFDFGNLKIHFGYVNLF